MKNNTKRGMQTPLIKLSADESAALDEGLRSEQTERIYTLEEAFEFARKRRKEWMKAPATTA